MMKPYLFSILLLSSCATTSIESAPEFCSNPELPNTVRPSSVSITVQEPEPAQASFQVPQQSIFERDPNYFDDSTHIAQCDLPMIGASLSISEKDATKDHQIVRVHTNKGEKQLDCAVKEINDWDVGIRYACDGFTLDQIGGDGSTEFHLKGKIDGKKFDVRDFVTGTSPAEMLCSFPQSVYTTKLPEIETLLTCPVDMYPTDHETKITSSFEASFAVTQSGESALTVMRHGDGDIGMYYAIPCEQSGGLFTCQGTLWPLELYKESLPEPESGIGIKFMLEEQKGEFFLSGDVEREELKTSACMQFTNF